MTGPAKFGSTLVSVVGADSKRCTGHILFRGPMGFEAFDSLDRSLGFYATQAGAVAAVAAQNEEAA